jgi:uncharacterized protein YktB (UPF0637 family)
LTQQLQAAEASLHKSMHTKQGLYNEYGAMLLGYILEVVKMPQIAEQYLVEVFAELQQADIESITRTGVNTFCSLQQIARKKLATFVQSLGDCNDNSNKPKGIIISGNRFVALMSPDEQYVFCSIHYHGKTIAALATELDKTETEVKQILKNSFTIIRNNRDAAAVHQ